MDRDRNGLVVLDRERCLTLLAGVSLARVGLSINGVPVVLPVFTPLEMIICCGEGTKLDAALRNATVAIEADAYDPATRTGWSVVVKGHARQVTESAEIERVASLGLPSWTHERPDRYIAIGADLISGRRLLHPE
jgi:nitroimidazol reductase NimA-like FMN-containing flavoprotein (pyridoxamine 5'-phosphate oxidase superfamily)